MTNVQKIEDQLKSLQDQYQKSLVIIGGLKKDIRFLKEQLDREKSGREYEAKTRKRLEQEVLKWEEQLEKEIADREKWIADIEQKYSDNMKKLSANMTKLVDKILRYLALNEYLKDGINNPSDIPTIDMSAILKLTNDIS